MQDDIALDEAAAMAPTLAIRRVAVSSTRLLDRAAWRDAALAWIAQRILFVAVVYVGRLLTTAHGFSQQVMSWSQLFTGLFGWDANLYVRIAREGYAHGWETAFYPILPGLEHLLMGVFGGNPGLAGLIVANVATLLVFGLLRVLVERELGRHVAQRALLYLACFPTAFFLIVPYTESLFLLFSVASFLALRRERWLLAGVCAALAELTRPLGILLIVAMLAEYLARYGRTGQWRAARRLAPLLGGVALPALALGVFTLWLRIATSATSPIAGELATSWDRELTVPGMGFVRAGGALLKAGLTPNAFQAHILLDAAFTVVFIALSVVMWKRLPFAYIVYTWATLAVVLMTPSHQWYALASNMRFMLVVFPLFMLLGVWGQRQWVDRLILICSLPLLTIFIMAFVGGGWVA